MPEFPTLPAVAAEPISVVLLAGDTDPHPEEAVRAWVSYLDSLHREYEILVADDVTLDRTAVLAQELEKVSPRARVLWDPTRRGIGAALRLALPAFKHPLLCCSTCDQQLRPEDLQLLLKEIDKVHIVTGYRLGPKVPGGLRIVGWLYRLGVRVLLGAPLDPLPTWLGWQGQWDRLLARVIFGLRFTDVACCFRLFRREVFTRIPLQSDGEFVHVEILAKANFLGHLMNEVPVRHQPRGDLDAVSKSNRRQYRRAAYRILTHPDFGPAILPVAPAPEPAQPEPVVESSSQDSPHV